MNNNEKSILISKEVHQKLKECSKKSGIKMKNLTETAILRYIRKIKVEDDEGNYIWNETEEK